MTRLAINHTIHCKDEKTTAKAVQMLANAILGFYASTSEKPQSLFMSLHGDLGAGKTTATRYLLQAMGYGGKVKSPTYSLCEEHILDLPNQALHVFHFDLYRMQSPAEWVDAGLLEHFTHSEYPTLCIIEWPEKAEHTLPTMDLAITLIHPHETESELARTVAIAAQSSKGEAVLQSLNADS
ncbi:tRNA (adenosine(37)-N6)-threonylcarbamoyltransferase complex ATPase subunit type 1 TsaE [Polynucleobacter sp. MWH-UH24A]|uniref:tRNA (adenosine(37)-N6)-threonylcarbamoyltransferase complex ATPase subunit type 1 TsaE n=1 Tax=Polynucleobacter sp. MWH-UH24A TaxID=2689110 RepID=UPI001BFD11D2|nr:tRNA (adenosine(37)-N6)-threonylcarbamoyltransferase complex ATPase subunit type 1 TsaE [Polynucleobacter sp. MWH-UH24A]QWD76454.1 tRNA (adenosine(37)-N6)-threonylcarbamoyltransferase complex ATPase subunit type 1 TsaE [Polynucleobacter sp. MWH-UH24A]